MQSKKDCNNPFSNLFSATSSVDLTDFTSIDDIVSTPMEELVEYIDFQGKHRFTNHQKLATLHHQCALNSYLLDKVSYHAIKYLNCIQASYDQDAGKRNQEFR